MFNRKLVLAAAYVGMLLFGIVFLSLGSVNNMLAERFHLNDNSIGTLTALLPFGILAGSLIFGPIADRFGFKWLLSACAFFVLVGLEGLVLASNIVVVQFCIWLIGFGGGVLNGATNALVADVSDDHSRSANLSLVGVFFGVGALTMPGLLALLSQYFTVTQIVSGIGALVSLPLIYMLVIKFPPPKQTAGTKFSDNLVLLKDPLLLLIGLVLAFQSGMEGMTNDWSTRYFKKVLSVSDRNCFYVLTAFVGAMTVSRLLLSGLLRSVPARSVLFVSFAIAGAAMVTISMAATFQVAAVGAILLGIGLAACFPVLLSYVGEMYPKQSGTAFSIAFFLSLIGNMSLNKSMGAVAQAYGIQQLTSVLLFSLACATILLFVVVQRLSRLQPKVVGK